MGGAACHLLPVGVEAAPWGWGGRAGQMERLFISLSSTHSVFRHSFWTTLILSHVAS